MIRWWHSCGAILISSCNAGVRSNTWHRPVHLLFRMRQPESDFFYGEQMPIWQHIAQLTRPMTAGSRNGGKPSEYVQDALCADAPEVERLICDGARIMVCGGRDMAAGVADTLGDILAPMGLNYAALKAKRRYVEGVD